MTAQAAEAAGAQDKFWDLHHLLYARQQEWAGLSPEEMIDQLAKYGEEVGLDVDRFLDDLQSDTVRDLIEQRYEEAGAMGLPGTPTIFINGQYYDGPRSDYVLGGLIKLYNYDGPMYAEPPSMDIDLDRAYFARVETNQGTFCIELFAEQTPQTVSSFVFLAQQGFYDGVPFHRVLPGFVAQTGDPTGGGFGGPGYRFNDEIDPDLLHDGPGIVSMANGGPNTNGSQFFITYTALPDLDGKHTVFGQVVEGMEVVEALQARDPQRDPYAPADVMNKVTIVSSCGS